MRCIEEINVNAVRLDDGRGIVSVRAMLSDSKLSPEETEIKAELYDNEARLVANCDFLPVTRERYPKLYGGCLTVCEPVESSEEKPFVYALSVLFEGEIIKRDIVLDFSSEKGCL